MAYGMGNIGGGDYFSDDVVDISNVTINGHKKMEFLPITWITDSDNSRKFLRNENENKIYIIYKDASNMVRFEILDVNTLARLSYYTSSSNLGTNKIESAILVGNILYAVSQTRIFRLDVTNPSGTFTSAGTTSGYANLGLFVFNNQVYVLRNSSSYPFKTYANRFEDLVSNSGYTPYLLADGKKSFCSLYDNNYFYIFYDDGTIEKRNSFSSVVSTINTGDTSLNKNKIGISNNYIYTLNDNEIKKYSKTNGSLVSNITTSGNLTQIKAYKDEIFIFESGTTSGSPVDINKYNESDTKIETLNTDLYRNMLDFYNNSYEVQYLKNEIFLTQKTDSEHYVLSPVYKNIKSITLK